MPKIKRSCPPSGVSPPEKRLRQGRSADHDGHRGCQCGASDVAVFALPGQPNSTRWCSKCPSKPRRAVNVDVKRCKCGSSTPCYGLAEEEPPVATYLPPPHTLGCLLRLCIWDCENLTPPPEGEGKRGSQRVRHFMFRFNVSGGAPIAPRSLQRRCLSGRSAVSAAAAGHPALPFLASPSWPPGGAPSAPPSPRKP